MLRSIFLRFCGGKSAPRPLENALAAAGACSARLFDPPAEWKRPVPRSSPRDERRED